MGLQIPSERRFIQYSAWWSSVVQTMVTSNREGFSVLVMASMASLSASVVVVMMDGNGRSTGIG